MVLWLLRELFLLQSLHFTLLAKKLLWEFVEGAQKELEVKSGKYFILFILFWVLLIPDAIITEKYAVTDAVGEVSIQVDLFTHPGSGEHKITVKGRVSVFDRRIRWSNSLNLIFIGISNARKNLHIYWTTAISLVVETHSHHCLDCKITVLTNVLLFKYV